jgi:hypothetical protein
MTKSLNVHYEKVYILASDHGTHTGLAGLSLRSVRARFSTRTTMWVLISFAASPPLDPCIVRKKKILFKRVWGQSYEVLWSVFEDG